MGGSISSDVPSVSSASASVPIFHVHRTLDENLDMAFLTCVFALWWHRAIELIIGCPTVGNGTGGREWVVVLQRTRRRRFMPKLEVDVSFRNIMQSRFAVKRRGKSGGMLAER